MQSICYPKQSEGSWIRDVWLRRFSIHCVQHNKSITKLFSILEYKYFINHLNLAK